MNNGYNPTIPHFQWPGTAAGALQWQNVSSEVCSTETETSWSRVSAHPRLINVRCRVACRHGWFVACCDLAWANKVFLITTSHSQKTSFLLKIEKLKFSAWYFYVCFCNFAESLVCVHLEIQEAYTHRILLSQQRQWSCQYDYKAWKVIKSVFYFCKNKFGTQNGFWSLTFWVVFSVQTRGTYDWNPGLPRIN